ncbi:hypothetical protein ACFQX6_39605 [Streptosporangium lutulentum]
MPSAAGLHLCARLAPGAEVDLDRVTAHAMEAGVMVENLATFCGEAPHKGES